jgi:hypothetical protein
MRIPVVAISCVLMGIGGFLVGRLSSSSGNHEENAAARRDGQKAELASGPGSASVRGHGGRPEAAQRRVDIANSAKAALAQGLDSTRIQRWLQLLGTMSPDEALDLADFLKAEKADGRGYPMATMLFWQEWARVDAKGALSYAREQKDAEGVSQLMKGWVVFDPVGAMAAFPELNETNPGLSGAALQGLASGLAGTSPAVAVDFAMGLPDKFKVSAANLVSETVVRESSVGEAQAWFDALPESAPIFQKEAVRVMLEHMTRRSAPGEVEKYVTERLDQAWSSRPAEQNFAASMILRNGSSPWDYVAKVMEKYQRPENPLALTTWVANLDPESAITWADANPGHPVADQVLAGTARVLLNRGEQEGANLLLGRVQDPALRDQAEAKEVVEKK